MNFFLNLPIRKFYPISFALIIAFTMAVYANSLKNEFTGWDDKDLIVNNAAIRSLSINNIKEIFTFHKGYTYQPLRVLSYAIDYHFWKLNPVGYHIHNIILHGIAGIFLFLALVNALPNIQGLHNAEKYEIRFIALLTSILFIVHPVNVEAVTWLSGRKYTMLSCFSWMSFYFFVKNTISSKPNIYYVIIAVTLSLFAMMSSPFGIAVPTIFFLYDFCRDKSDNVFKVIKKRFFYYLPYFIILSIMLPILWVALIAGDVGGADKAHIMGKPIYTLWTILSNLFDYIRNFFVPYWLNCRYLTYVYTSPWHYKILITIITFIVLVYCSYQKMQRGNKVWLFCFLWFICCWLPASNIIPIAIKMADRYVYLACIGIFIPIAILIVHLYKKSPFFISVTTCLLIIALSVMSVKRNFIWRNSIVLWQDSVNKDSYNSIAHNNLGNALLNQNKLDQAIIHLKQAIELYPDFYKAHYNIGNAFSKLNDFDKAIKHYKEALRLWPDSIMALTNLGSALRKKGDLEQALFYFNKGLKIKPNDPYIHNNLGNLYFMQGETEQAFIHYTKAVNNDSNNEEILCNMGNIMLVKGKIDEAISYYEKAVAIDPNYWKPYYNIGNILSSQGDDIQSQEYYMKVLKIYPQHVDANYKIALILLKQGKIQTGIQHLMRVIKVSPNHSDAYFYLGNAYLLNNNFADAIQYYTKALSINPNYPDAYYNMGVIDYDQGKIESALNNFLKAIDYNPNYVDALVKAVQILIADKDSDFFSPENALELAQQAVSTAGESIVAWDILGMAYAALQNFQKAVEIGEKVLDMAVSSQEVLNIGDYKQKLLSYKKQGVYQK